MHAKCISYVQHIYISFMVFEGSKILEWQVPYFTTTDVRLTVRWKVVQHTSPIVCDSQGYQVFSLVVHQ